MTLFRLPLNNWWIGHLSENHELWRHFHITTAPEQYSIAPYNAWVDHVQ